MHDIQRKIIDILCDVREGSLSAEKFTRVREIVDKELMPVCSQCNNLYLHGE